MRKKKIGKHLKFYIDCMNEKGMPQAGLCSCADHGFINERILLLFTPPYEALERLQEEKLIMTCEMSTFWGAGTKVNNGYNINEREYGFTPLRQTIVLFMACLNGEL